MSQREKLLNQQIAFLVGNAPQDGITPGAVNLIASVLKAIAEQLQHTQYYVLQDANEAWLLSTLSNRESPDIEKTVFYAYCSHTMANIERLKANEPGLECVSYGVIEILFRLLGMKQVDSVIFFDRATDAQRGIEVSRTDLEKLCEKQVQRVKYSHRKLQEMRASTSNIA